MVLTSRISILLLAVLLFVLPGTQLDAQSIKIKGIVTDTIGIAIPWATVFSPAIQRGTTAGNDGKFSLDLTGQQESVTVIVSAIGYLADTVLISPRNAGTDLSAIL